MNWQIAETQDRETCYDLRFKVFVQEQGVPAEIEVDEYDPTATHFLATVDGRPVGTARIMISGDTALIGRVCVLSEMRGAGLGSALIQHGIARANENDAVQRVVLGAQVVAIPFYEKLGFRIAGPVYDSAGIDHRDMVRALA